MPTPEPNAAQVARRFLVALGERDWDGLRGLLADDVWLRALLTREVVEAHDGDEALRALRAWHGDTRGFAVLDTQQHSIELRELVRHRFAERPAWAPQQWHLIEQTGYLRVREGRITRLDLVCTGYHPVDAPKVAVVHRDDAPVDAGIALTTGTELISPVLPLSRAAEVVPAPVGGEAGRQAGGRLVAGSRAWRPPR